MPRRHIFLMIVMFISCFITAESFVVGLVSIAAWERYAIRLSLLVNYSLGIYWLFGYLWQREIRAGGLGENREPGQDAGR